MYFKIGRIEKEICLVCSAGIYLTVPIYYKTKIPTTTPLSQWLAII